MSDEVFGVVGSSSAKSELSPQARRMRSAIQRVLVELLDEVEFDRVTVDMVVKRADIHRSTFYRHYSSLANLLGECLCEHFGKLSRLVPPYDDPDFEKAAELALADNYREIMRYPVLYSYSKLERRGLSLSPEHIVALRRESQLFASATTRAFALKHGMTSPSFDHLVLMQEMAGTVLIDRWIAGGFKKSPEEFAKASLSFFEELALATLRCGL